MKFNLSEITDRQIWGDMRFFGHELNYFLIQLLCTFLPFGIISMILQKISSFANLKTVFLLLLYFAMLFTFSSPSEFFWKFLAAL